MSLTEQGLTVDGEAPQRLLVWLTAIDGCYTQVQAEGARDGA